MPEYAQVVTDPTTGRQKFRWEGLIEWEYPYDPSKPVMLLAAPPGGVAHANFPFMVKGDPGLGAVFVTTPDVTVLEWDDPSPDVFQIVELAPATPTTRQVLKVVATQRKGPPGTDGASVLNPASFSGTVAYKRMLQVNSGSNGFELVAQKVGGMHWPTSITEAPAGTTGPAQLTTIDVPANTYPFAWRPDLKGMSIVSATSADVQVNLVARLGSSGGPVVGKCAGLPGLSDRLILASGPDTGAGDTVNKIAANAAATIYIRTEKVGGTGTYATGVVDPSRFSMTVIAVP